MRRRLGDKAVWLLVAALALLLVVLGVLQYRWIGEIGRAEAERQQARLEGSARRFAAVLDRELGRVLLAFRQEPDSLGSDARGVLLERLALWRARSEHAALVERITIVTPAGAGPTAEATTPGGTAFEPAPLPAGLEPLLSRLGEGRGEPSWRGFRPDALVADPLALVVPLLALEPEAGPSFGRGSLRLQGLAVVQLDRGYLSEQILPQLAEAFFGPLEGGEYTVAVVERRARSVVYSSDPQLPLDELWPGDLQQDLLAAPLRPGWPGDRFAPRDGRRPPVARDERPREGRDEPPPPAPERERRARPMDRRRLGPAPERSPGGGPWVLVVRHRGGSLAEAVAAARRRNVAVGLGVLALLGTAAALLAVGGQRARRLAHQQLEFVAGVTHELNTPLAAIRSAGQNLTDGIVSESSQVRRYGQLIQREADRLTALVGQVLDFAGIQTGSRVYASEPLALAPLLGAAVRDAALVLEQAGLEATLHVADGLPPIRGDRVALERALANLLTNAAKFAAGGRELRVSARRTGHDRVELRVEDRGPGIPGAERERVFEPFYRGSAAQRGHVPGSGLGLSLVRRVVAAHAGRVWIESREGGGTAVVIELRPAPAGAEGTA